MIELDRLENKVAIGDMIRRRARHFANEQEWENYLASHGIGVETDFAYVSKKITPEKMQIWDVGWNDQRLAAWRARPGSDYIRKYLILPREFVEKALVLTELP